MRDGIELESGEKLEADLVVAATGLNLRGQGDIDIVVDGKSTKLADTIGYYGFMFTGVPNLVWVFGYWRQGWTLRVDLLGDFVCRLLKHLDAKHAASVTATLRPQDRDMKIGGYVGGDTSFNPGYLLRQQLEHMPKSGDKPEWMHPQNYWEERNIYPAIDLDNEILVYGYDGAESGAAVPIKGASRRA